MGKTKSKMTEKEAADIARIAHAAQREADFIDYLENQPNDFTVQTWEFLLPREKEEAIALVQAKANGAGIETKFYHGGKVFDLVAGTLI